MNEQTSGYLRHLLAGLASLAALFGWLSPEEIARWVKFVQDVAGPVVQIAGPIAVLSGYVWSWWVNRPTALVASVVAMADDPGSPVKGVLTTPTMAGRDLAKEFESNKIAPVGTHDAKVIAATAP